MQLSIKSLLGSVLLAAMPLVFTSCEGTLDDLFGEWSKPTPSTPGPAAVTSITLNETTLYKNKGDAAVTLTATVVPENAAEKTVTWSSDNPAVASVNNGEVTALAIGTAIITATANDGSGVKAICTVNVSAQGLLSGDFSIAADKKVRFAQGNLQAVIGSGPTNTYNYTASSWKFAVHQWDYIGNAPGNNSFDSGTTVDLFGWVGTSATYDTYGLCIQDVYNNNTSDDDDFSKCYGHKNTDALKNDWGKLLIVNGGDAPDYGWRTLSKDEWEWLIGPKASPNPGTNCRTSSKIGDVTNARWVKARVHSTDGLIIFPDEISWDESTMGTAPTTINTQAAAFATKAFSDTQWEALETAGCVFLPAAGYRYGTSYTPGSGRYWTSTVNNHDDSKALHITGGEVNMGGIRSRNYGYSVRLVMDVK